MISGVQTAKEKHEKDPEHIKHMNPSKANRCKKTFDFHGEMGRKKGSEKDKLHKQETSKTI